ncbi:MAG TPA: EAL domain-containing protein [Thermoanaerobaculia bacterium]|nr:EAL domain-containing protein [Thermoanaerobaculia bacterium]
MPDQVAEAALERALQDHDELVLFYQPIHDARTRAIYGAEALLRQRRESGELREAAIIHETAEESCGPELFVLDNILVKKSYGDAARWQAEHPDVRLNVNLSPREFQEGNVLERLSALVTSCGIETSRINVEITETSYIEHPEQTMEVLKELKKTGISLWLDDFGSGHSSLTHLQHFPVDGIKLPGCFIKPLPNEKRCRAIVKSLLSLAHELGLEVIAEEVENQEQLDFLLDHDCDYIQGFLFNKPMPAPEFQALLNRP